MRGSLLLAPCFVAVAVSLHVPWRTDVDLLDILSAEDMDATRTALPLPRLSATDSRMISSELDHFISDIMKQWDVPGLQVAIVKRRDDSTEYDVETKAYGVRGHDQRPMRTDVSGLKKNKWMNR